MNKLTELMVASGLVAGKRVAIYERTPESITAGYAPYGIYTDGSLWGTANTLTNAKALVRTLWDD